MPKANEIQFLIVQPHSQCRGFGCRACQMTGRETAALDFASIVKAVAAAIEAGAIDTEETEEIVAGPRDQGPEN